jgi:prephenate dehydratase
MKRIYALGPAGTNGHEAACRILQRTPEDSRPEIKFSDSHAEVFERVVTEECYAVVPIENSSAGLVEETKRFWLQQEDMQPPIALHVIGEVTLLITHALAVRKSLRTKPVQVLSHPQALAQCREHLLRHELTNMSSTASTAGAGKLIAEDEKYAQCAALVSPFAADIYRLRMLYEHMEDHRGNSTRFHVLGRTTCPPVGACRTAMLFWLKNAPRALMNAMWAIGVDGVNMTTIHSIPLGDPGQYAFYVEFDEHADTEKGKDVMKRLETVVERFFLLGSYPREEGGPL